MSPETLIGVELGKGVLQHLLDQGTMGAVYLAYQSHLQRQVAVKVFLPASLLEQADHEEFLKRLEHEISLGASLDHAHILPILDYGQQGGLVYQFMPYIAGESLQTLLARSGALPFAQILQYLEQLAAALDYAHGRGILHRDIKPGNILLTTEGSLLLSDFGLAGLTTEKSFASVRRAMPGMLNYIAPEYVLGKALDQRADLYSLGAVLYQMVTGTVLFQGASLGEVAMKHVKAAPLSPRSLRADLPQAAEQVILRALAKRPDERYSHAQDLASAFRLALEAAQPLPAENQATNALSLLSELANGSTATMGRISAPRGGSLFDPKWQAPAPSPVAGEKQSFGVAAVPPLPAIPTTPELATSSAEQKFSELLSQPRTNLAGMTGQDSSGIPAQESASLTEQTTLSLLAGQGLKRPGLLRLAHFQGGAFGQPSAQDQVQATQESASDGSLKLADTPSGNTEELRLATFQQTQGATGMLSALSTVPYSGENTGTIKLTEGVRIVQVPVAGQPGRFVTGFLPMLPTDQPTGELPAMTTRKRRNKSMAIASLVLAILIVVVSSGVFWYTRNHSNPTIQKAQVPSNSSTSATAQATATMGANLILSDSLSQNIHNWPVGKQGPFTYTFQDGAYHISNNNKTMSAPALLPNKVINGPFTYSLTMEQIKGDESSLNNQFGMILYASIQNTNGKQIDKFYAFEVLNKSGGQYQFWKYDNSKNSTQPWSTLWSKNFGKEFLQGSGSSHINTFKVVADGKMFTFIVNGKQVGTWKDNSFSSGNVGMLVNLNGAEVAFSNLLLTNS